MTVAHRRDAAEQARRDAALKDLFEQRNTFNQVLGLQVESTRLDDVRLSFEMRPELIGHYLHQRLHGGVISATLDAMGGFAVMVAVGERHPSETADQVMHRFMKLGTIDLRVDFLRQGIGKRFTASAEVTRLGGRVGSTQMRLVNEEGTLIATAAAAYMIS